MGVGFAAAAMSQADLLGGAFPQVGCEIEDGAGDGDCSGESQGREGTDAFGSCGPEGEEDEESRADADSDCSGGAAGDFEGAVERGFAPAEDHQGDKLQQE